MSFGGGSKSSTTTNNNLDETNISQVDNRVAEDNAIIGGSVFITPTDSPVGSISLQSTDLGAIKGGVDIALESIRGIQSSTANAIAANNSVTSDLTKQGFDLAQAARQSETSGAINNLVKYGTWIALAALVVWGVVSYRKG